MSNGEIKGWFDLDPERLKEAVLNLDRRGLKAAGEDLVRGRISEFEEDKLISPEEARELSGHIDSLVDKRGKRQGL